MAWLLKLAVVSLLGAVILRTYLGFRGSFQDADDELPKTLEEAIGGIPIPREIDEFSDIVGRKIELIKITDEVTVGFGASYVNSIFIDAPDGLIIVDTAETVESAANLYSELRKTNKRPVKAIIYTHYHGDHTQGAQAFLQDSDPNNPPDIWGHYKMPLIMDRNLLVARKTGRGIAHQFGAALGSAQVWPRIPYGLKLTETLRPTRHIYEDVENHTIAGMNLTFLYVPGETDDHIAVFIPDSGVLMPGDNIYWSFPNLYAIRGTPHRDILEWAGVIRKMRDLNAKYLVPSHMTPVIGQQAVYDRMTAYDCAIRYVHDQTVRYMNELYHPDEIAKLVQLPPALKELVYLREMYGKIEWSAKSVYQHHVGWFSGDPVDLQPLTPTERSKMLVELVGLDRALLAAETALKDGNSQWALELSSHVVRVQPDNRKAKRIRLEALRTRASETTNTGARNFYLTAALDGAGLLNVRADFSAIIKHACMAEVLQLTTVQLKAELTHGVNSTIYLHFTDSGNQFRLQILYSVLTVDALPVDAKIPATETVVSTTEPVWKGIVFKVLTPAVAFNNGDLKVAGSLDTVRQFMSYF